jgi:hypothetical protein
MGDLIKFKALRPLFMALLVIMRLLSEKIFCSWKKKLGFSKSSKAETGNINFGTYYFTISLAISYGELAELLVVETLSYSSSSLSSTLEIYF